MWREYQPLAIDIIDLFYEQCTTNQEMCRFYSIQPWDMIIIRGSFFSHAMCSFDFGQQIESDFIDSSVDTTGSVLIQLCLFEDYSTSSTLTIYEPGTQFSCKRQQQRLKCEFCSAGDHH